MATRTTASRGYGMTDEELAVAQAAAQTEVNEIYDTIVAVQATDVTEEWNQTPMRQAIMQGRKAQVDDHERRINSTFLHRIQRQANEQSASAKMRMASLAVEEEEAHELAAFVQTMQNRHSERVLDKMRLMKQNGW